MTVNNERGLCAVEEGWRFSVSSDVSKLLFYDIRF
jgi:hypothetical protein